MSESNEKKQKYRLTVSSKMAVIIVQDILGIMGGGGMTAAGKRGWQHLVLGLLLCLRVAHAADDPYRIELLLSEQNGPYHTLAQALTNELQQLPTTTYRIQQSLAAKPDRTQISLADLTVTIGSNAAQQIQSITTQGQVLHLLIPSTTFNNATATATPSRHSAIFIDQPWQRQLNLIQLTLPGVERVGLLLGNTSRALRPQLEQAIQAQQWQPLIGMVTEAGSYLGPLRRLLEQSDVLLAIPDQSIFNRQNLQGILLTSYRREVPLIGFSPGYVRAGALAAVYSTPEQIAHEAAQWITRLIEDRSRSLPAPHHPSEYSVAVNHQVARSLGLRVPDEATLLMDLQRMESAP